MGGVDRPGNGPSVTDITCMGSACVTVSLQVKGRDGGSAVPPACSHCHVSFPRRCDSVIVHVVLRASLRVVVTVAKVGIISWDSEAGLDG